MANPQHNQVGQDQKNSGQHNQTQPGQDQKNQAQQNQDQRNQVQPKQDQPKQDQQQQGQDAGVEQLDPAQKQSHVDKDQAPGSQPLPGVNEQHGGEGNRRNS